MMSPDTREASNREMLENARKLNTNQVLLPSSSYEGTIVWWGGGGGGAILPEDVINASTVCLLRPLARLAYAPSSGSQLPPSFNTQRRPVDTYIPLLPPKE